MLTVRNALRHPANLFAAAAAASLTALTPAALAQTANADDPEVIVLPEPEREPLRPPERLVEEIVVTGSRIVRTDLAANSPIAVFDAEQLKFSNTTNAEEFLRDMPQFVAGLGENTNNGNPGAATIDLRNLGEQRTLVLVDGKRFIPFSAAGAVDLSMIPVSLIERVEVITGGASAVYGSDAVAGVVNFILKKRFEGVETDISYEITERGDGERMDMSVTWGGNIGNTGNVVVNFGYSDQEGVFQGDRAFSVSSLNNQLQPFGSFTTPWGSLLGGDFDGIEQTIPGLVQFDQQGNGTIVGTADTFNFNPFNLLKTPQKKFTGTAIADLDVTDTISAYSRLSVANSQVDTIIAPTGTFFFPFQINTDNPFLSEQAQNALAQEDDDDDGLVQLLFGRRLVELGTRDSLYENSALQMVGGLQGVAFDGIRWDAFFQYGRTTRTQNFINDVSADRAQQSILSVQDPDGTIRCQDPSGGCVPGNFFGPGLLSAQAADFIRVNINENNKTEQFILGGSIAGETRWQLPIANAPLAYAVGAEIRREQGRNLPDSTFEQGGAIGFGSSSRVDAEIEIDELFGEVSLPIIDTVRVEGGLRYAQYSNSAITRTGSAQNDFDNVSYKLLAEWSPIDELRLRGGFQRAVRAPNLLEIGLPRTPSTGDLNFDPCEGDNPVGNQALTDLCIATGVPEDQIGNVVSIVAGQINNFVGGNPLLEPEEAESFTVGLVYTPDLLPITVSLDYYTIDIEDAIEQISEQNIVNACYNIERNANSTFCSLVNRNPVTGGLVGGTDTGVDVSLINAGNTTRSGIDLNINYALELGRWGSLDFDLALNQVLESTNQEAGFLPSNECKGLVGTSCVRPEPETRFIQTTNWLYGPWSVNLRWQYIDSLTNDNIVLDGVSADTFAVPKIGSESYFDLSASYAIGAMSSIRVGIFNLLDQDPPIVGNTYGGTAENSGNTYPATYDPLGRRFAIGYNARF